MERTQDGRSHSQHRSVPGGVGTQAGGKQERGYPSAVLGSPPADLLQEARPAPLLNAARGRQPSEGFHTTKTRREHEPPVRTLQKPERRIFVKGKRGVGPPPPRRQDTVQVSHIKDVPPTSLDLRTGLDQTRS